MHAQYFCCQWWWWLFLRPRYVPCVMLTQWVIRCCEYIVCNFIASWRYACLVKISKIWPRQDRRLQKSPTIRATNKWSKFHLRSFPYCLFVSSGSRVQLSKDSREAKAVDLILLVSESWHSDSLTYLRPYWPIFPSISRSIRLTNSMQIVTGIEVNSEAYFPCGNIAQVPKARGQYSRNWGK